ncbi:glutamate 5-kinase [Pontixanthobacter gangjinensis]|uniref:Glutamate 5-kinase n=1 Tax=Pontixanthobacter gangjinensis TaxID=1028742 RepID=A0A6I4SMV0_9SPHN|nr:glutamate 5-kinase [Pontixanthobacter gangjinensis]MXO56450.1 glutamate 5-kinase [Pontixanthobacter gangjinensis]
MTIESLRDLTSAETCSTLVLKVGSSLLVDAKGQPRQEWLAGLVDEIAKMCALGQRIVVVSSGAIALGAARLGLPKGGRASLADAQAAASVGQIALSGLWSSLLEQRGLSAAQMLVTLGDLEERRRYLNASSTLSRLLEAGVVPVVNENDSVATEEIRFGDNDRLAARVGQAAGANAVILLSDVDGLMDRDPAEPGAQFVPIVRGVTDTIRAMAGAISGSGMGSGGMVSKIQAAEIAERAGISLAIINGQNQCPISRAVERNLGTIFVPTRQDGAKRAWLGGRIAPLGTLVVDEGCIAALAKGASLLAAGIVRVDGTFERSQLVTIADSDGCAIAQGLAEYDAETCVRLSGKRQSEQAEILGHAPRSAVVHRDHMVML